MMLNKKNKKIHDLGEIIIGFALFFVGFAKLKETSGILLDNLDLTGLQALTNLHLGPVNVSVLISFDRNRDDGLLPVFSRYHGDYHAPHHYGRDSV